jgi:hypothetical protein
MSPFPFSKLRDRRNGLAHDIGTEADWDELDSAVDCIEQALQELHFIGKRPKLDIHIERSALEPSSDPQLAGTFNYLVQIASDDKTALEWKWSMNIHRINASQFL